MYISLLKQWTMYIMHVNDSVVIHLSSKWYLKIKVELGEAVETDLIYLEFLSRILRQNGQRITLKKWTHVPVTISTHLLLKLQR